MIARAPGYAPGRASIEAEGLDAATPRLILSLRPGGRLAGRVGDGQGTPVAGASVAVVPHGEDEILDEMAARYGLARGHPHLLVASSDAEGVFEVDRLVYGVMYTAAAAQEGSAPSERITGLDGGPDRAVVRLDLVLSRCGSVLVEAVDPDGEPAGGTLVNAGADVCVFLPEGGPRLVNGFPPGTVTLAAKTSGRPGVKRRVVVPAGGCVSVTLRFREGLPLEGVVVDEAGKPVPRAMVEARFTDEDGWFVSGACDATDGAGRVMLVGPAAVPHRITVDADDFARGVLTARPGNGVFGITLVRGGTVRGKVRHREGSAFAGAMVEVDGPEGVRATTDVSGSFDVRLSAGLHSFRATTPRPERVGRWSPPTEVRVGETTGVDLVLD